ncbi:MAG: transporter [Phycisphaerales bacterium]|nr:transporter [Phycisphaerales bacterium]
MPTTNAAASACAIVLSTACLAQPLPDKSAYTIFNPTPRELRRPLSADRPDATESPYTVDAGAVQLEMSIAEHALREAGGRTARSWAIAPLNLKIGLTNSADVQFLFDPYLIEDDPQEGDRRGVGNLGLRFKVNLFGNDGGDAALALLPFVRFPTGDSGVASDRVEGGLVVPFAVSLGERWSLGLQVEVAFVRDGDNTKYDTVLSHTAALGHELTERLGVFVEYIGEAAVGAGDDYSPSVAGGFTYAISGDVQLDAGVVAGLDHPETESVRLFAGVTVRF